MVRNIKWPYVVVLLLTLVFSSSPGFAAPPTLAVPVIQYVGTNMATMILKSSSSGTGYFTLLNGNDTSCGSGAQIAAGHNSTGAMAAYHGSLPLVAGTPGYYTVRNLSQSKQYTICFTADSLDGSGLNQNPLSAGVVTAVVTSDSNGASGWSLVGSAGFSDVVSWNNSLVFAPDGTPYVSVQGYQSADSTYPVLVMKYSNGIWSMVGSIGFTTATGSSPQSLAFAPDGTPYVLFSDSANAGKTTVKRYANGSWNLVGIAGFSAGTAYKPALAFAPDGTPSVLFGEGIDRKATMMQFRGGIWNVVGSAGVSAGSIDCPSLAFAPDGSTYAAYVDYSNGMAATMLKYSGGIWSTVGTSGFTGAGGVFNTSLAVAPDGIPYVAFINYGDNGNAKVMKFSDGFWNTVGSNPVSDAGINGVNFTSLAIAPEGTPYIAYEDGGNSYKATVMRFSGNTWSPVGIPGFSGAGSNSVNYTSLAVDPAGAVTLAFTDGNSNWQTTVMKYTAISGTPPATSVVGMYYTFTPVVVSDSVTGYYISGTIPPGLQFDSTTGTLFGIPQTAGVYANIVIGFTDSSGATALPPFTITVSTLAATGPCRIVGNPQVFSTLQGAFTSAGSGAEVQAVGMIFDEKLTMVTAGSLKLSGGWDATFSIQSGYSVLKRALVINKGKLVVSHMRVRI